MGWNSTVLIHNDELGRIEKDKDFGQKLSDAIRQKFGNKEPVTIPGGEVVETHHADGICIVAVGGNYATVLHEVYGRIAHHKEDDQIVLLKELAAKFGFELVRKPNPENKRSKRK